MTNEGENITSTEENRPPPLLAVSLLFVAFGLALLTAWFPTLEHLADPSWTGHQRFHAFREIFMASFFGIAGLVLCQGPFRRGEPRSLAVVGLLGLGVVGGFWVGLPITGAGKSGLEPYLNHGLQALTLLVGCAIAHSASRRS